MQTDVAVLAGIVCEAALYGIFLVLNIATLYILVFRKKNQHINTPMVVTSVLMFLLATAQLVVDTTALFQGFINMERPERPIFLADDTVPINAATHAIFFTMMILGDIIVIYRCYLVWGKNIWIVSLPILLSFSSAVCAYLTIWATQHPEAGSFVLSDEWPFGTAIFSCSLAANIISTCFIAYRIWRSERQFFNARSNVSLSFSRTSLKPIAVIIIESGALNAAYLCAYMGVLDSASDALEIMASIATPLVGIVFSLVIVRVGLNPMRDSNISTLVSRTKLPSTGRQTVVHVSKATDQDCGTALELSSLEEGGGNKVNII